MFILVVSIPFVFVTGELEGAPCQRFRSFIFQPHIKMVCVFVVINFTIKNQKSKSSMPMTFYILFVGVGVLNNEIKFGI